MAAKSPKPRAIRSIDRVAGNLTHGFRGGILLAVSNPATAAGLAALATALAQARQTSVLVVNVLMAGRDAEPPAQAEPEDPGAWRAVVIALETLAASDVSSAWLVCRAADVGRAIRRIASAVDSEMVLLGWRGKAQPDGTFLNATLQDVLQDPATDVAVIGGDAPEHFSRVLVPFASGPHSRMALRLGVDLAQHCEPVNGDVEAKLTALRVVPSKSTASEMQDAAHALRTALGDRADEDHVSSKIVLADDRAQAILAELDTGYDMVIMGTSQEALIDRLLFGEVPQSVADGSNVAVIVTRRHSALPSRIVRRSWHAVSDVMPKLSTDERSEVNHAIRRGAQGSADFYVMTGLSAIIATLGLLLNSPAVIIGAMLVAPLMAAIVGMSLGIVDGDAWLLRRAARTSLQGVLLAVVIGLITGWLIPGTTPNSEIMSRTQPNLLDLGVALAAGAAGAYAICRKEVAAALAGVAVAVALVPPLATVGIGLSMARLDIASGASLLFATNLVAIAAASTLIFLLLGFAPPETQKKRRRTLQRSLWGAVALLLVVTLILATLTYLSLREAQLARTLEAAVRNQLTASPDTEMTNLEYSRDADGVLHLVLTVRSDRTISSQDVFRMQSSLAEQLQRPVAVSLIVIPVLRLEPVEPPPETDSTS